MFYKKYVMFRNMMLRECSETILLPSYFKQFQLRQKTLLYGIIWKASYKKHHIFFSIANYVTNLESWSTFKIYFVKIL